MTPQQARDRFYRAIQAATYDPLGLNDDHSAIVEKHAVEVTADALSRCGVDEKYAVKLASRTTGTPYSRFVACAKAMGIKV